MSLNNSDWQTKNVDPSVIVNYPLDRKYGFSPVHIDASTSRGFALINSVREFDFLVSDEQKDMLWNNGRPDQVILPEAQYLKCTGEYLSSGF